MGLFDYFTQRIGIDLGTSNTLIYVKNKGITIDEPSVVAINKVTNEVCAVGVQAKAMIDRTPRTISAIRPLKDGVIADFEVTRAMIKYFINLALNNKRFVKSNVVICVPVGVTSIEKRAVEEVAIDAGARKVKIIEEPMAAAIGAGIKVEEPLGNMIVDIGGGTTEIAVISLGGIVVSESLRIAGDDMDENIRDYIKLKYKMYIGLITSENIKKTLGNASEEYYRKAINKNNSNEEVEPIEILKTMEIRGRDIISGYPLSITVSHEEIREAIIDTVNNVVSAIRRVLEKTPPELSSDIYQNGIFLTGGGAMLKGLDSYIEKETGLNVKIADNALECVVLGAGKICEEM